MNAFVVEHWVSCSRFTVLVATDERGVVLRKGSAPLVARFAGQPLKNLLGWARSLGGFRYELL